MFQIDDTIIYGTEGVCRIVGIEEKSIGGKKQKYYVLKTVKENSITIYAPLENEQIRKKMRRLLSTEEINALIQAMPDETTYWVNNPNERKDRFKGILERGDHLELIQMIKSIYAHKNAREAEGKRLHISDEHFFRDAEQILYNEFQYVLNLESKDDLMAYIISHVEK